MLQPEEGEKAGLVETKQSETGKYVIWRCGRSNDHVEIKQVTLYGKVLFWLGVAVIGLGVVVWHAFFVKGVSPLIHPLQQVVPFLSGSLLGICLLAPLVNRPGWKK